MDRAFAATEDDNDDGEDDDDILELLADSVALSQSAGVIVSPIFGQPSIDSSSSISRSKSTSGESGGDRTALPPLPLLSARQRSASSSKRSCVIEMRVWLIGAADLILSVDCDGTE